MSEAHNMREERDLFGELGDYDFENEPQFILNHKAAKQKAKQQLAISTDSPFNISNFRDELSLKRMKEERAELLRRETEEIREQLELVKTKLAEIKSQSSYRNGNESQPTSESNEDSEVRTLNNSSKPSQKNATEEQEASKRAKDRKTDRIEPSLRTITLEGSPGSNLKYRPLTGKTDCPNCECDRRSSICNKCSSLATSRSSLDLRETGTQRNLTNKEPLSTKSPCVDYSNNYDERPIRPAKPNQALTEVETKDVVVPGKVYTIAKNLNEKRTTLAKAIDDLHSMIDKVRERDEQLERERKLVQLYKNQWKFGPKSSGGRNGQYQQQPFQRSYESRLDANLARDTKSLLGYRHVKPCLRTRSTSRDRSTQDLSASGRKAPASIRDRQSVRVVHKRQPMRSASLESIRRYTPSNHKDTSKTQKALSQFHNGKSSSEMDLNTNSKTIGEEEENDDDIEVEEALEIPTTRTDEEDKDKSDQNDIERGGARSGSTLPDLASEVDIESKQCQDSGSNERVQRMAWIPVFGETEIKTVKRTSVPRRKVQLLNRPTRPIQREISPMHQAPGQTNLKGTMSQSGSSPSRLRDRTSHKSNTSISTKSKNHVMVEAKKKLQFASDLLNKERQDSSTRNRLIIKRTTRASEEIHRPPHEARFLSKRVHDRQPSSTEAGCSNSSPITVKNVPKLTAETHNEILRLEEMLNNQQRLLNKMCQSHNRHQQTLVPPSVTIRCSSPCCCPNSGKCNHSPSSSDSTSSSSGRQSSNKSAKSLISNLKDRLNKSKMRLARTLEEEHNKYEQLKQKIDSSLRKQTDLEAENELLKKSLTKCFDTCLKDISNTFESISETLNDSIANIGHGSRGSHRDTATSSTARPNEDCEDISVSRNESILENTAQLIAENRVLKQMKDQIQNIERQRKDIFEELTKEKFKSCQLEAKLKEMSQLIESNRSLGTQIEQIFRKDGPSAGTNRVESSGRTTPLSAEGNSVIEQQAPECQPSTSKQSLEASSNAIDKFSETDRELDRSDAAADNSTFNSIDLYRRFIESVSPDIESIKRERRLIINEFDNLKRIIHDIDP